MRPIAHILHRPRNSEQAEFSAAFVMGVANEVILNHAGIESRDARTISFQRGTILVGVSHGAVAGILQQRAAELILEINKKLITGRQAPPQVTKITTRLQSPPTP